MIERLSVEEWQAFDRQYPAPTFFARPAWAISLSEAYADMEPSPTQGARAGPATAHRAPHANERRRFTLARIPRLPNGRLHMFFARRRNARHTGSK